MVMNADILDMAPPRKKPRTEEHEKLFRRLDRIRKRRSFSNQQLADFIGISLPTLESWLYGVKMPSRLTMPLIVAAEKKSRQ